MTIYYNIDMRRPINHRKRQKVFERDGFKCVICSKTDNIANLEVDHIIPVVNGGTNDISNLQTMCYKCNMNKRFGKVTTFNDLSPRNRLLRLKERMEDYKDLSWNEFKIIFVMDEIFRKSMINRDDVKELFFEISEVSKRESSSGERSRRHKFERDALIHLLKIKNGLNLKQMEEILNKNGIHIGFQHVSKVCKQFKNNIEE